MNHYIIAEIFKTTKIPQAIVRAIDHYKYIVKIFPRLALTSLTDLVAEYQSSLVILKLRMIATIKIEDQNYYNMTKELNDNHRNLL